MVRTAALSIVLLCACEPAPAPDAGPADAGPREDAGHPTVIAAETADAPALARLTDWRALPIFLEGHLSQMSSEERGGTGTVPTTLLERGNRDMSHFLCRGAQADVREPNLVDFRFDVERCPEAYVRGAVVARFDGPGVMVRFWSTLLSIKRSRPDHERLLIWVDDGPEPVVDVPLAEILGAEPPEIFAPPFGAGSSDHVAWYYPVVFGDKLVVALDGLGPFDLVYHQTTVLLGEPGPRTAASDRLDRRDDALASLRTTDRGPLLSAPVTLGPGELFTFERPGPATFAAIGVRADDLVALADVTVRVFWEGASEASIDLPLLELFAASLDPPGSDAPVLSASHDADGWSMRLGLPMPFTSSASIALSNTGSASVSLELFVEETAGVPDAPFGHLVVQRSETLGPTTERAHPVAQHAGRGRLVGACLMMEGRGLPGAGTFESPLNFLEGDEEIEIDGVMLRGTGTEDYFDGAFYFAEGASRSPFAQAWGVAATASSGRASACRWHVRTNAIDFASALDFALEIGPGAPATLTRYRSVAFLYL